MKKGIIILVTGVILIFMVFNIFWYVSTKNLYSPYAEGMEKIETFTYCTHDEDEFGYLVGLPSYLHFNTGCLSVTSAKDNTSLIIWPQYNSGAFKFGLRLPYKGEKYEIEITKDGKALNSYEQEIIDENINSVERLYDKAEKQWGDSVWGP